MLTYDKMVVGGNINAITFAFKNSLPVIFNKPKPPLSFDESLKDWNQMLFILGLAGLHPFSSLASSIRVEEDSVIKAVVGPRQKRIKFKELLIFDDDGIEGLPLAKKKVKEHLVLDWMRPKSCSKHNLDTITSDDKFVKEIIFYPAFCHSGRAMVVKSFLTRQELESYEYSDTYARYKEEAMMKKAGLIGRRDGDYKLSVETQSREVKKYKMSEYEDTDNLKFIYNSGPKYDIIENDSYLEKLKDYFGKRVTK